MRGRSAKFWLTVALLGSLTAAALAYFGMAWLAGKSAAGADESLEVLKASGRKHVAAWVADVQSTKAWLRTGSTRDAGEFLNARVAWSPGDGTTTASSSIPTPIGAKLLFVEPWTATPPDTFALWADEMDWMAEAKKYDHWRLQDASTFKGEYPMMGLPIPNYSSFEFWAKVRLLRGRGKDFAQASAEVRNLAFLLASTEDVVGAMIAKRLLDVERDAIEAFSKAGDEAAASLTPISKEQTAAFTRAAMSSSAVFNAGGDRAVFAQANKAAHGSPIRCMGVAEASMMASMLRPMLEDLEEFGTGFEDLEAASRQDDCFSDRAKIMWNTAPKTPSETMARLQAKRTLPGQEAEEAPAQWSTNGFFFAPLRQAWGKILYTMGTMDLDRHYGQN